jgi:hypothetical protein
VIDGRATDLARLADICRLKDELADLFGRKVSCRRSRCTACCVTRFWTRRALCMQRDRLLLAEISDSIERIVE